MALTINPDSVSITPTQDPLIFEMACSVTDDAGVTYQAVTARVNKNMKKDELVVALTGKRNEKAVPIAAAAAYRDLLVKTTLADIMVRPVVKAEPITEPITEQAKGAL